MTFLDPFEKIISIYKSKKKQTLTFVGLGPGDPNLLTIAAVDAINHANLVAYPVAYQGAKSIAKDIAINLIKNKKTLPLVLPMVRDNKKLNSAWKIARNQLLEGIESFRKVVFICQGDPSIFSTSYYLLHYLKCNEANYEIKVIPGVTSFNAAAAIYKSPLSLQKESLLIKPAPDEPDKLYELLDEVISSNQVLVLLKLGSRWLWMKEIIKKKNLLEETIFAQRIGFNDEIIVRASDVKLKEISYFSLLIIRKSPNYIFN